ncbi:carboxymuconolactone decarboxylase family protein [Chondromyces apiculatus]|uniref:4-carboxymuconolactone decarboxylase domain/alkylhydroperoxidase AhpD family core domain protein n=1 Tax=Chondromyces apiculatus DSM 436 TaxID=1192034 RepID=A0A017ST11_9BACT|nr:carboxymuconolactone decarboxylase family protein [Chondromyces apiculatus]EYF00123.1 4-carboxymuconolactone decarboxylase domain/alkylhydroperoxidase AhpD family core domain protein [Chondromyces apiculatus DSM 436]
MEARLDFKAVSPEAYKALLGVSMVAHRSGLDKKLLALVDMRASQINGCAFCIDMHSKDARSWGETEQRLYGLSAWRETPFYTARERAALEWTEAVTLVGEGHVPDEVFTRVKEHFSEQELVGLTVAVAAINAWNRMAITFRSVPGSYEPAKVT